MKIEDIEIHVGKPTFEYTSVRQLEAKCEAATNFSAAPTMEAVNGKLRALAAQVGANAIIHVEYQSGMSMTSWRSMKGTGLAVVRVSDEIACPSCAETIKRAAAKCRFCGAEVPKAPVAQARAPDFRIGNPVDTRPVHRPAPHAHHEPLKSNDNPLPWVIAGIVVLVLLFGMLAS